MRAVVIGLGLLVVIGGTGSAIGQTEQAKLTASDADAGYLFGYPVALSGDTVVIGAIGHVEGGAAYVFTRLGATWVQQAKLTPLDAESGDGFGRAVALSGDIAVIGAPNDNGAGLLTGSAYVFTRLGATWVQQAKLTASDAEAGDGFGWAVSVSGDTAVIGAYSANPGAAYVFTRLGPTWVQQAKLTASDAEAGDVFGSAVSVSGDTAVIGAYGANPGAAYVFTRSGASWVQQAKLTASDAEAYDVFGSAVSVSGDTAVIGRLWDDASGDESGSAYVFMRLGATWVQQAKLTASDAEAYKWFGSSVSVSGDTAIIGAPGTDHGVVRSGSAYVFTRANGAWHQHAKLTASDADADDFFGDAVSVSGDTAVVGASGDDDRGDESGSAYVFDVGAGGGSNPGLLPPQGLTPDINDPHNAATSRLLHVGLGDSYASGEGTFLYDTETDQSWNRCHRGPGSFQRLLSHPGTTVINKQYACSGAVTADVDRRTNPSHGGEIRQTAWLHQGVDLVTLSIGGNDAGFADVLSYCVTQAVSCTQHEDVYEQRILGIQDDLQGVYYSVLEAAPNARVYVLGYPNLFADPSSPGVTDCVVGIDEDEMRMLRRLRSRMTLVIEDAIQAVQNFFPGRHLEHVPLHELFSGQEVCSNWPWIHGLIPEDRLPPIAPESFHLTGYGHARIEDCLAGVVFRGSHADC